VCNVSNDATLLNGIALYGLHSCNAPWFCCWFWHYINHLLTSFLTYLLFYLVHYLFTYLRIAPFLFQAGVHKRQPILALVLRVYFVLWYILLQTHVCFSCVRVSFSVLSQEIGWEERLQNDRFCVGWDIKP